MNIIVDPDLAASQLNTNLSPRSATSGDSSAKPSARGESRFSAIFSQAELEQISKVGKVKERRKRKRGKENYTCSKMHDLLVY